MECAKLHGITESYDKNKQSHPGSLSYCIHCDKYFHVDISTDGAPTCLENKCSCQGGIVPSTIFSSEKNYGESSSVGWIVSRVHKKKYYIYAFFSEMKYLKVTDVHRDNLIPMLTSFVILDLSKIRLIRNRII